MRKNKNCKSTLEAIGNVERERRRKKVETSAVCFASRKGRCSILKVSKCDGLSCGFYKTEEQYREGRKKAFERIRTLDKSFQMNISETYYKGKKLWLKGGEK